VDALRKKILDGQWGPGSQLPPRVELLRSLKTTPVTLHQAVQRLVNDGFLRTAAGSGTFVSELPPHLNTYAVVFIYDPANWIDKQNWSRYYQALTQAAVRLQQETGKRLLMFHGLDQHADSEERTRLITHIERQRLAGLIFTNHPYLFEGTPILDAPGIPRVAMMSEPDAKLPHVPAVSFDGNMWVAKALDHLAGQGRRRVALIDFGMGPDFSARVQAGLAARGMVSHRRWHQFVSLRNAEGATNAVELLMNDRERPDALLVEDDNFVEQAVAGLVAAGVSVPEEVTVIGHANFPVAPTKLLPMRLLGYDANLFMRTAVDLIDRQRAGEQVPRETMAPALWEEEVGVARPPVVRSQNSEFRSRKMELAVS
jgi:DNA-binding LacI/PurR family transcriptional regulator